MAPPTGIRGRDAGRTVKEFERKDLAIKFCDTPLVLFHTSNRCKVRPLQEVVEYFLLQLNQQRFAVNGGRRRILQEIQPSSRRSIITTIRHGRVQLLKHRDRIGSILKERDQATSIVRLLLYGNFSCGYPAHEQ